MHDINTAIADHFEMAMNRILQGKAVLTESEIALNKIISAYDMALKDEKFCAPTILHAAIEMAKLRSA